MSTFSASSNKLLYYFAPRIEGYLNPLDNVEIDLMKGLGSDVFSRILEIIDKDASNDFKSLSIHMQYMAVELVALGAPSLGYKKPVLLSWIINQTCNTLNATSKSRDAIRSIMYSIGWNMDEFKELILNSHTLQPVCADTESKVAKSEAQASLCDRYTQTELLAVASNDKILIADPDFYQTTIETTHLQRQANEIKQEPIVVELKSKKDSGIDLTQAEATSTFSKQNEPACELQQHPKRASKVTHAFKSMIRKIRSKLSPANKKL